MATTTIINAATLNEFVSTTFSYTKGKGEEKQTLSTTMVAENFGRLPNRKEYKDTEFGKALHSLYTNNSYMLTVKGNNQREKYARKVEESITNWFKLCGIEDTTSNRYALFEAMGVKKSTKTINKDTDDEYKQIDSALASESTFTKNVLFVCYTFITKGVWLTKVPKIAEAVAKQSAITTFVGINDEDFARMSAERLGMSVEAYKAKFMANKATA